MKKLLILPFLILLTGCVSYYYPQTALKDGVYYAEDDPSYVVYSNSYSGIAYYPWYSLDYFYMGYHPYPRYGYGGGGRWSFGFGFGYSPWYHPYGYYGYYSPWYASYNHYPYYPAWRPYHGYYSRHNGGYHRGGGDHRGGRHDRYAGNDRYDQLDPGDDSGQSNGGSDDRGSRGNPPHSYDTSQVSRYVSTAPAGYSDNRGMVIRSRGSAKTGKNRLEPDKSAPVATANVTPASYPSTQRDYQRRRSDSEVRYSSGAKQSRARTGPVESSPNASGIAINAEPQRTVAAGGNGGGSAHSAPSGTTRQASGRPPAASRPNAPASNSSRSRSSASRSSLSNQRESSRSHSSRREHRK